MLTNRYLNEPLFSAIDNNVAITMCIICFEIS